MILCATACFRKSRTSRCRWADPKAGDGVGMLFKCPMRFSAKSHQSLLSTCPKKALMVWQVFLPPDDTARATIENIIMKKSPPKVMVFWAGAMCRSIIGSRLLIVPTEPVIKQIFIDNGKGGEQQGFERDLFIIRRLIELTVKAENWRKQKTFSTSHPCRLTRCFIKACFCRASWPLL